MIQERGKILGEVCEVIRRKDSVEAQINSKNEALRKLEESLAPSKEQETKL